MELLVVSGNLASLKMTRWIFTKRSMPLALIVICSMWNKSTLSYSCNDGKFTLILYPDVGIDKAIELFWVQTQRDSLLPWPAFFVKILFYIYIYIIYIPIFLFWSQIEWSLNPVIRRSLSLTLKEFFSDRRGVILYPRGFRVALNVWRAMLLLLFWHQVTRRLHSPPNSCILN